MVSGGDRSRTVVRYEVWSQVLEGLQVATGQQYQGRCSATADCSFQPQMLWVSDWVQTGQGNDDMDMDI